MVSHRGGREARVTGDEAQGTMGRDQEKDVWVRGRWRGTYKYRK